MPSGFLFLSLTLWHSLSAVAEKAFKNSSFLSCYSKLLAGSLWKVWFELIPEFYSECPLQSLEGMDDRAFRIQSMFHCLCCDSMAWFELQQNRFCYMVLLFISVSVTALPEDNGMLSQCLLLVVRILRVPS